MVVFSRCAARGGQVRRCLSLATLRSPHGLPSGHVLIPTWTRISSRLPHAVPGSALGTGRQGAGEGGLSRRLTPRASRWSAEPLRSAEEGSRCQDGGTQTAKAGARGARWEPRGQLSSAQRCVGGRLPPLSPECCVAPKDASGPLPWSNSSSSSSVNAVIALSTEKSANPLGAQNDFVRVPSARRLAARGRTQRALGFQP